MTRTQSKLFTCLKQFLSILQNNAQIMGPDSMDIVDGYITLITGRSQRGGWHGLVSWDQDDNGFKDAIVEYVEQQLYPEVNHV